MIKFNKPQNLNGLQLIHELKAAGVSIEKPPFIDGNGEFWLDINFADKEKAAVVVMNHNGATIAPELTVVEKLASVGLDLDDLKSALGL